MAGAAVVLGGAPPAHAHLMTTGFGPFYDGLTHLLVTPEYLLPMIALSLLAGLHGPRFGRAVLFALPAAWLAGSLADLVVHSPATAPVVTATATILLGALVAADRHLPLAVVVALAIVLGLLAGGIGGGEIVRPGSFALGAGGLAAAPFGVIAVVAGKVATVQAWWARIAVRAAGSWIAAIGLLMLGWALRTP